jgi:hypothetical protein
MLGDPIRGKRHKGTGMNHPLTHVTCRISRTVAPQGSVALPAHSPSRRRRSPPTSPARVFAIQQQLDQEVRIFSFFPSAGKNEFTARSSEANYANRNFRRPRYVNIYALQSPRVTLIVDHLKLLLGRPEADLSIGKLREIRTTGGSGTALLRRARCLGRRGRARSRSG